MFNELNLPENEIKKPIVFEFNNSNVEKELIPLLETIDKKIEIMKNINKSIDPELLKEQVYSNLAYQLVIDYQNFKEEKEQYIYVENKKKYLEELINKIQTNMRNYFELLKANQEYIKKLEYEKVTRNKIKNYFTFYNKTSKEKMEILNDFVLYYEKYKNDEIVLKIISEEIPNVEQFVSEIKQFVDIDGAEEYLDNIDNFFVTSKTIGKLLNDSIPLLRNNELNNSLNYINERFEECENIIDLRDIIKDMDIICKRYPDVNFDNIYENYYFFVEKAKVFNNENDIIFEAKGYNNIFKLIMSKLLTKNNERIIEIEKLLTENNYLQKEINNGINVKNSSNIVSDLCRKYNNKDNENNDYYKQLEIEKEKLNNINDKIQDVTIELNRNQSKNGLSKLFSTKKILELKDKMSELQLSYSEEESIINRTQTEIENTNKSLFDDKKEFEDKYHMTMTEAIIIISNDNYLEEMDLKLSTLNDQRDSLEDEKLNLIKDNENINSFDIMKNEKIMLMKKVNE